MRRQAGTVLGLLLLLTISAVAQTPTPTIGKTLKEAWEAVYIEDAKAGHSHLLCRQVTVGERELIQCTLQLEFNLRRLNQDVRLTSSAADYETPDGKVVTVGYQQGLNGQQTLLHQGRINDNQLTIATTLGNQAPTQSTLTWDPQTLGIYTEARLFRDRKLKQGDELDYLYFLPEFKRVFRLHVTVKNQEEVKLLDGTKKRLLRIEKQVPEKIAGAALPPEVDWLDDNGDPVKRLMEIPGIGATTFYRTTEAVARARSTTPPVDISSNQVVRMSRVIPRSDETRQVIYRVRLRDVEEPGKAFATDDRQEIRNQRGDQFEIVVHGYLTPSAAAASVRGDPPRECLKSNHFVCSDDAEVAKLARNAVGMTLDPWDKAGRIVQWVFANLKKQDLAQTFTPADEVARKKDGDCRQHAVLACAMCRAAGVPARTAIGLVHSPADRGMIFHMWIEVWIAGKWYALDPTRGDHPVGAGHIKISDQDWNDEVSLKPFLAVNRVLGKVQIEMVSAKYESP